MPTVRIPLAGQPVHRADGTSAYVSEAVDQRFVNCFFKVFSNPLTGKRSLALSKRPAANLTLTGPTGGFVLGAAATDVGYVSVWKTGTNEIKVYEGTTEEASATPTAPIYGSRPIQFLDGSTADLHLAFWVATSNPANYKMFVYNLIDDTLTELSTAGLPIGGFVFKDGFLFFMLPGGRIYNFNLNDFSTIGASSYITNSSGVGMGISEYRDKIVAFSGREIEFYRNAGNPTGSPLARVDEARLTGYGIRPASLSGGNPIFDASHKYIKAFDTVFWLNNELSDGGIGLYMLDGFRPKKVSTPEIDTIMASTADYRDLSISGAVSLYGSPCIVLHHTDTDLFYVYQLDTGSWVVWSLTIGYGSANVVPVVQTSSDEAEIISTEWYEMNMVADSDYADSGGAYTMTVQTSKIDLGTDKRKFIHSVKLIGDEQASGTATLEYSDDDYANWTSAGTFDMTKHEKKIHRVGSHKGGRAYRLTHNANTAFRAEALEIEYSVGAT